MIVALALMAIFHSSESRAPPTQADGNADIDIATLQNTLERLETVLNYYQQLLVRNLLSEADLPRLGRY